MEDGSVKKLQGVLKELGLAEFSDEAPEEDVVASTCESLQLLALKLGEGAVLLAKLGIKAGESRELLDKGAEAMYKAGQIAGEQFLEIKALKAELAQQVSAAAELLPAEEL